ncbi:MAG: hypothetical protein EOP04_21555 [Proteobacteria bacterium]|nr:MAG: hypothetical protein EOP04_21555 [Pseudomonadota bacterium]
MKTLTDRLFSLLSRATVKDSQRQNKTAKLSVETGEGDPIAVDQYEPYGFAFNPMEGAEAILMSPAGYENYTFSFLVQDRSRKRPDLRKGDATIYASEKTFVRVSPTNGIEILAPIVKINSNERSILSTKILECDVSDFRVSSEKSFEIKSNNFSFTNGKIELLTILSQMIDVLSTLTVKTDDGTLNVNTAAPLREIKLKLDTLR